MSSNEFRLQGADLAAAERLLQWADNPVWREQLVRTGMGDEQRGNAEIYGGVLGWIHWTGWKTNYCSDLLVGQWIWMPPGYEQHEHKFIFTVPRASDDYIGEWVRRGGVFRLPELDAVTRMVGRLPAESRMALVWGGFDGLLEGLGEQVAERYC